MANSQLFVKSFVFDRNQFLTKTMPKGHNQKHDNEGQTQQGSQQNRHLKNSASEKEKNKKSQGRNANEDQSGGTKGSNAV
jgi:hypothetical protein